MSADGRSAGGISTDCDIKIRCLTVESVPSAEAFPPASHRPAGVGVREPSTKAFHRFRTGDTVKPLFIPLKTQFYEAFLNGTKTVELRQHGPRWNEQTCQIGRAVTISKGYGKANRRAGVITSFDVRHIDSPDWLACYGEPGNAACIGIRLDDHESHEAHETERDADAFV